MAKLKRPTNTDTFKQCNIKAEAYEIQADVAMLRLTGAQGDEGLGDTAPEALEGIRFLFSLFVYLFCVLFSERLGLGRPKCRLNGCNIVRPLNAWEIEGAKTRVVFSIDLDLIASTYYLLASFCKLYDD